MGLLSSFVETPEERVRRIELAHAERIKALEMGRALPEVEIAQAKAEEVRARAAAGWAIVRVICGVVGPAAVSGITLGGTAIVLHQASPSLHALLLSVLWVCSAVVCVAMIAAFLLGPQQLNLPDGVRRQVLRKPTPHDRTADTIDPESLELDERDRLSRSFQK